MNTVMIGPVFFIGSFIFMGGFRDGSRGFAFALLKMSYFTQIYCRRKEIAWNSNFLDNDVKKLSD
jgi:hypothetical protein